MHLKPIIPMRFLLAIGLLLFSASLIVEHFVRLPDFANGFMKGIGIGVIFILVIYYSKKKQPDTNTPA